jgi:hypothetical protein
MTRPSDGFNMIYDVLKGLKKTGNQEEWGFQLWPLGGHELQGRKSYYGEYDEYGDYLTYSWWALLYRYDNPKGINADKILKIKAVLINDRGKIISTINSDIICRMGIRIFEKVYDEPYNQKRIIVRPKSMKRNITFGSISAEDITDVLTIKLVEVDGIDVETAISNGYIKISQGNI